MLQLFQVENYRNFKDKLVLDFREVSGYKYNQDCIYQNTLAKMLIYGANATGKTNLVLALTDVRSIFFDGINNNNFLNAYNRKNYASFRYIFKLDKDIIEYQYSKFSKRFLRDEKLIINGKEFYHIYFDGENITQNRKYNFSDLLQYLSIEQSSINNYLQNLESSIEREYETMPFLRWLCSNVALNQQSLLLKLKKEILGIYSSTTVSAEFFENTIQKANEILIFDDNFDKFKQLLKVMNLSDNVILLDTPVGEELYFHFEDTDRQLSFYKNASSGMKNLLKFHLNLCQLKKRGISVLLLDEFDAFYHYEMSSAIVRWIKEQYPQIQVIFTTHNTNLMSRHLMRPDCLFILSTRGKLTALNKATNRELREGHNLEKMYISGEFADYE